MSSSDRIVAILERMAALAARGGADVAASALARVATEVRDEPQRGARSVAAMYGGMGSLNDVVLYRDGQPLAQENREFDALRSELFELSLALREAG